MYSFDLNLVLTQQLQNLSNEFAKEYAKLAQYSDEVKNQIHRYAKISMIGASTRIENAVLTDPEIEWIDTLLTHDQKPTAFLSHKKIIEAKLNKDRERSIEEVAGCRATLELIYNEGQTFKPLTETIIRGLHYELMHFYQKAGPDIGRYKVQSNSVIETNHDTKKRRTIFQTAEAGPVTAAAMSDLVRWYNEACLKEHWTIATATEFVYRFLAIHPFQDGNGRLGRALFLLALLQSNDLIIAKLAPYLAIDRQIEQRKYEYYSILNRCSNGKFQRDATKYRIDYFLKYMINVLQAALLDIEVYKTRFDAFQQLSESACKVLSCFKENPQLRLTTKQISEITHLPNRTISHCLSLLNKQQFIQRYGQGAGVRYQLIF